MMRSLLAAIAAFLATTGLATPSYEATCGHADFFREAYVHGLSPTLEKPKWLRILEGLTDTDVVSCNVQLEPNFATNGLTGTTTMVIRSTVDGLNQFHLRLGNNFAVTNCTVNGATAPFTFDDASHAHVDLPSVVNTNQQFTLVIGYNGIVSSQFFGSIAFGTHNSNPYCFTLSEPWYAYTWWPNKDDNTDKALMSIWVTVPNTMMVAANGTLQGTDALSGSRTRYRYACASPMSPYLLCFGATNYTRFTDTYNYTGGSMPMEFFIWPENDSTTNRNVWLNIKNMLATLAPWYGLYPFVNDKYGVYQFSFGGGMEHQTMTGQGGGGAFSENVSVHELGHQWWGDNITCATWMDIWLNEGFATYTEAVWLEKKSGSTGLAALKSAMQSRKPTSMNGTVYCFDITDPNRIFSTNFTYRKGGWALHMLRHVLGDTAFWQGMQFYRNRFALSTATTNDFQVAMQDSSGKNLDTFFQQWVYQPGAPTYEYGWASTTAGGSNYVMLHIKQTQTASYPTFAMPVDIRTTVGGVPTTTPVNNFARTQNYLIPVSAAPTTVTLDEDGWILNSGVTNVAYVPGPPKVVRSSPLPGAVFGGSQRMTVTFHTNVNINASQVTLRRVATGTNYAIGVTYNASTFTVGISSIQKLPAGAYEIRIADTVTAVDSGQALDGELNGTGSAAYPSGDGVPAGGLVIPFTISYGP